MSLLVVFHFMSIRVDQSDQNWQEGVCVCLWDSGWDLVGLYVSVSMGQWLIDDVLMLND